MVGLANDPAVIDSSLEKLVDTFNAELPPGEQDKRCSLAQESAGGRMWTTLKAGGLPIRRDLDLRWRLPGGGFGSRDRRARHRDAERRLRAGLVGGVPSVSSPRQPESTRPRLPG